MANLELVFQIKQVWLNILFVLFLFLFLLLLSFILAETLTRRTSHQFVAENPEQRARKDAQCQQDMAKQVRLVSVCGALTNENEVYENKTAFYRLDKISSGNVTRKVKTKAFIVKSARTEKLN